MEKKLILYLLRIQTYLQLWIFFLIGKNERDNSSAYNSVKYKVSDQHMFVEWVHLQCIHLKEQQNTSSIRKSTHFRHIWTMKIQHSLSPIYYTL